MEGTACFLTLSLLAFLSSPTHAFPRPQLLVSAVKEVRGNQGANPIGCNLFFLAQGWPDAACLPCLLATHSLPGRV